MKTLNIEVPEKGYIIFDCEKCEITDAFLLKNDGRILIKKENNTVQHSYLHPKERIVDHETLETMVNTMYALDSA